MLKENYTKKEIEYSNLIALNNSVIFQGFVILHVNVRSLNANFENLEI